MGGTRRDGLDTEVDSGEITSVADYLGDTNALGGEFIDEDEYEKYVGSESGPIAATVVE